MATPKQTDPQFKLRLPASLKEQIEQAAAESNRSMNAEIVRRLEAYDAIWAQMIEMSGEKERLEGKLSALRAVDTTEGLLRILEDVTERLERIEKKIDY